MSTVRKLKNLKPLVHRAMGVVSPLANWICPEDDMIASDLEPLTIMFPVHPKDAGDLELCISYARKNVAHPIERIVVVGPEDHSLSQECQRLGVEFLPEDEAFELTSAEVKTRLLAKGYDRWSWIYQQLLKLSVDQAVPSASGNYLIIDSDTLLLRRTAFKVGDCCLQQFSHERNGLYIKSYQYLVGEGERPFPLSFVTHFMFCEARILKALRAAIELRHPGKDWFEVIMDLADAPIWTDEDRANTPFNYFSEYESYGNFSYSYYPENKRRYFFNHGAYEYQPDRESVESYLKRLPAIYRWVSFHKYFYKENQLT